MSDSSNAMKRMPVPRSFRLPGESHEDYCLRQLHEIRLSYEAETKPWIDELASIQMMKPPKPLFIEALPDDLKKLFDGEA